MTPRNALSEGRAARGPGAVRAQPREPSVQPVRLQPKRAPAGAPFNNERHRSGQTASCPRPRSVAPWRNAPLGLRRGERGHAKPQAFDCKRLRPLVRLAAEFRDRGEPNRPRQAACADGPIGADTGDTAAPGVKD